MSTKKFTVQPARNPSPEAANALLDRLEAELTRLERVRPQLQATAKKAANIIVSHLAGRPSVPVVRVRITVSGKARFLFTSLTGNGATYVVDPKSWSCSCPAYHRYPGPCKHALSAYVLWRVAHPDRTVAAVIRRAPDGCPAGCQDGILRITHEYVHQHTGEVQKRTMRLPCRRCKGGAA